MINKSERRDWELPPEKIEILHLAGNLKGLAESAVAFVGSRLAANSESMMMEDSGWREWKEAKRIFWVETSRKGPNILCHFFGTEFSVVPLGQEPKGKGQIGIRFNDEGENPISEILLKGQEFISSLRENIPPLAFPKGINSWRISFPTALGAEDPKIYTGNDETKVWQRQLFRGSQVSNIATIVREIEAQLFLPNSNF